MLLAAGPGLVLLYLIAASFLWAFSFGLIKGHLVDYDPLAVAWARLSISLLLFLPWLLRTRIEGRRALLAMGLGSVQFGLMYGFYIAAYAFLPAWAVALFTIFTPLYVIGIHDGLNRHWIGRHAWTAALAVAGAALIVARGFEAAGAWRGIGLLQLANLCFALGQVGYRRLVRGWRREASEAPPEATLLGWMYLGAVLVTGVAALALADPGRVAFDRSAWLVLLYLGALPTAAGFYLWNRGAARAGAGQLAVLNNLKIPLAVLVAWLVFGESADRLRVLGGLAVIVAALFLAGDGRAGAAKEA